jgi:hypothetical protein
MSKVEKIMKFSVNKNGKYHKNIEVLLENVKLEDFTIRKICPKNEPEPKMILKKIGYLPKTFWDNYTPLYFLINDDCHFTYVDMNTQILFENKYTIIID